MIRWLTAPPLLTLLGAVALSAVFAAPAGAAKVHLFEGDFGSVAQPAFEGIAALAVDPSSGDLLVADARTQTLSRFHPDGTPHPFSALGSHIIDAKGTGGDCPSVPAACDRTPQNGFGFTDGVGETQIAVDNSGTITDGNIYVTQGDKAAGNLVDIFASDGEYIGQLTAAGSLPFGATGSFPFSPCGVAVDSAGMVYLAGGYDEAIYKFDPSANPPVNADHVATFPTPRRVCSLASGAGPNAGSLFVTTFFTHVGNSLLQLDPNTGAIKGVIDANENRLVSVDAATGQLYVFGGRLIPGSGGSLQDYAIREYHVSGSNVQSISTTPVFPNFKGLAASGGGFFVGPKSGGVFQPVSVYGPVVTIPEATTDNAELTGDNSVTLHGTVDPDGEPIEECRFEYGPTTAYGQSIPCDETVGEIGTVEKAVHADLSGLSSETLYNFRLVVKNANAAVVAGNRSFKTPSKPGVPGVWSVDVGIAEATLKAEVNPENSPTNYRFEWGTDTSYGNSTGEISIGSGNDDQVVTLPLEGLLPDTIYHYRLVATNSIGVTEVSDHTFVTYPTAGAPKSDCPNQVFRTGPSAMLPDCRAFEMVSPVDKNGGDIKVLVTGREFPARLEQASETGDRMAYSSASAFAGALSAPWTSEYLATRTAGGWSTEAINPPRESESPSYIGLILDAQYKAFSADLSSGWLFQDTTPLDDCAPEGVLNLYRRDNRTGEYEALIPSQPVGVPSEGYRLELQGVSKDGTRSVFRANARLTPDAAKTNNAYQLYEHVRGEGCGELRLVSLLPNGKATTENVDASVGVGGQPGEYREGTVSRAVSDDGTRVFFTLGGAETPGALYVRINADQEQSLVSSGKCTEPERGCTLPIAASKARFWTAASDGKKVIYSVPGDGGEDLLEFDVEKALAGEPAKSTIAESVSGVVGASQDASRMYFVSREQLDGEGVAGSPNLYRYEPGKTDSERYELVATVSPQDLRAQQVNLGVGIAGPGPITNGVRLTADGSRLAFVSSGSLTGYDNTDTRSGEPSLEVYLYNAESEDLACISCNPSGARPQGRMYEIRPDLRWPRAAMMPAGQSQAFAPRVLSEDGDSLFFESFEALLPRDVNGKADVYQWQRAADQAQCEAVGAELYVPTAGGCLSLISTGQSSTDSEIADATPDGSNVFIRTGESLLPQDPGQVDLYVARVEGGFPPPPSPPAACEGEACQGPLALPDDPTPASSSFHGPGNVNDKPSSKPCPKGKIRKKGRCVPKPCPKGKARKKGHCVNQDKSGGRANNGRRAAR